MTRTSLISSFVCAFLAIFPPVLRSQEPALKRGDPAWLLPLPEIQADQKIPILESVIGHAWGQEITSPEQIIQYLEALAKAAPDRTKLVPFEFKTTYEGRPLQYLIITSAANLKRLDAIRADILRLADPRTLTDAESQALIPKTPAIVWLAYGVHGNEISSSDAALLAAYTLLADQRAETKAWLDQLVIIIDPCQNPDGRARFLANYRQGKGVEPSPEPFAAERVEPWPGGRFNHYLFDMNRDWYLQTQRETQNRVKAYLEWQPQIYVDSHEMGSETNYYFDPPTDPYNSQITPRQREWLTDIGRKQGERFDHYGFPYSTRETFDNFYPGYGSTWPTIQGAFGILWEQASARGLKVDRPDGTTLHYHDGVRHHYISSLLTVEVAAARKDDLLRVFHETRSSAVEAGMKPDSNDYILLAGQTPARAARLADLLLANGIEVFRLKTPTQARVQATDGKTEQVDVPAGSYFVPAAQPAGRFARTLLERTDDMGQTFIDRQIDRKARRLGDEIYDITAWSLPLTYAIECRPGRLVGRPDLEPLKPSDTRDADRLNAKATAATTSPKVGYLVPADDEAALSLLAWSLREGHRVHVADQTFILQGRKFDRGTLLYRSAENLDALKDELPLKAGSLGLELIPTDTSFVDEGASLGGDNVTWIKPPKVLLAVGEPVTPFAGHTWYLFDQVWKYPVTRVPTTLLREALDPAEGYNVLVLPNGSYDLGESAVAKIKDFVRGGGTLITVGGATRWATGESVGLIASKPRERKVEPIPGEGLDPVVDQKVDKTPAEPFPAEALPAHSKKDSEDADETPKESPDPVPGAFLRANFYPDHFVNFGLPTSVDLLVNTSLILEPLKPTDGRNLVNFGEGLKPTAGFVWPATLELLARSPYVVYQELGDGHIVGFVDDPNFRAMSPVSSRLFQNAFFFGPGH